MGTGAIRSVVVAVCGGMMLAGCVTDVALVPHDSFPYNGQDVPITRETYTLGDAGPQTRYFVQLNFVRYPCDGTVPDCRATFLRAESFPQATRL